jgi:hypothetical protein
VLPLRLAIPHFEPVLALNLDKEVRKDALVIQRAGDARTLFVDVKRALRVQTPR